VISDNDHPDIERSSTEGAGGAEWRRSSPAPGSTSGTSGGPQGLRQCEGSDDDCFDPDKNPALRARSRQRAELRARSHDQAGDPVRQRATRTSISRSRHRLDSEAYLTVSGRTNNSVRVTDEFLKGGGGGRKWDSPGDRPARSPRPSRRAICGRRSLAAGRRGLGCNTTRPSTTGTHAPASGPSGRRTVLGIHFSRHGCTSPR